MLYSISYPAFYQQMCEPASHLPASQDRWGVQDYPTAYNTIAYYSVILQHIILYYIIILQHVVLHIVLYYIIYIKSEKCVVLNYISLLHCSMI